MYFLMLQLKAYLFFLLYIYYAFEINMLLLKCLYPKGSNMPIITLISAKDLPEKGKKHNIDIQLVPFEVFI